MKLTLSLLLLGIIAVLVPLSPGKALEPVPIYTHFANNYFFTDCAPGGGLATRIVLVNHPFWRDHDQQLRLSFPQLNINLWTLTPPVHQWLPLIQFQGKEGAAIWCPKENECQIATMDLWLDRVTRKVIDGKWREHNPSHPGKPTHDFEAQLIPTHAICQ